MDGVEVEDGRTVTPEPPSTRGGDLMPASVLPPTEGLQPTQNGEPGSASGQSIAGELDRGGFWGRYASAVAAGLTVAFVAGFVLSLIAVGGRHGVGSPIDWGAMFAYVLAIALLGANLIMGGFALTRLVRVESSRPEGIHAWRWRLGLWLTSGISALLLVDFGPGWWALLPILGTLVTTWWATRMPRRNRFWKGKASDWLLPLATRTRLAGFLVSLANSTVVGCFVGIWLQRVLA